MLYQAQHSTTTDKVTLEAGSDLVFPTHIHSSFEIIIATQGEIEITVGSNKYTISNNECVLVFPNQLHEIKATSHANHAILIFSPYLVRAFTKKVEARIPESNKFCLSDFLIDKITKLDANHTTVELKGLLYSICGEFDKNAQYLEFNGDKDNLLFKIFNFVAQNYKKSCSLYQLSSEINYSYVYLSKHFSKHTGISYTEYVRHFRINEACYLLKNTNRTVLDIAYECGFDCLRSFNRSFKSVTGVTPSAYRSQNPSKQLAKQS
jgi:AraC-like DNA-binding protein/quercetin dioxygenase-like cupin family protein